MGEQFEVWLCANEDGDHAVSLDDAEAAQEACAEYGGQLHRTVKLVPVMDLPTNEDSEGNVQEVVVQVPAPPEPPENGDAEEAPIELPAEQSAPAEVAA
jgi:hypothetical protein